MITVSILYNYPSFYSAGLIATLVTVDPAGYNT